MTTFKTSESVSNGHPDKVCDQIADAIFDYLRAFKEDAQSAVEVSAAAHALMIFGEIDHDIVYDNAENLESTSTNKVSDINPSLSENIENIVEKTLYNIGYQRDAYNPVIYNELVVQSAEINNAVEESEQHEAAAGDQGIVTGFATKETTAHHELHYWLANRISHHFQELRKSDIPVLGSVWYPWNSILLPDAKSQVTIQYDENHIPVAVDNILISQSHVSDVDFEELKWKIKDEVIQFTARTIRNDYALDNKEQLIQSLINTTVRVNPAGEWTNSYGPAADSGLTSRKLVVDNYGSAAPIGGGGQAGKNANKVDRSGACYARWIAKNVVAHGLADRVLVEIGFAIGVPEAVSFAVDTYGTEKVDLSDIYTYIENTFGKEHKVSSMIELCNSIDSYEDTARNGFYTNDNFPWEVIV